MFYVRREGDLVRNKRFGLQWYGGPTVRFRWGRNKLWFGWSRWVCWWRPFFFYSVAAAENPRKADVTLTSADFEG